MCHVAGGRIRSVRVHPLLVVVAVAVAAATMSAAVVAVEEESYPKP